MSDERKATEILLSIEQDVKQILKFVQNLDLNSKIQTERSRLILEKLEQPVAVPVKAPQPPATPRATATAIDRPPPPVAPPTKSPFLQTSDLKSKIKQAMVEAQLDEKLEKELVVEKGPQPPKRGQRNPGIKQVVVQQKIVYENDSKNVYMAAVDIIDAAGSIVKQTKTTQTGKWMAPLPPGEYNVKVSKAGTPLKPAVDVMYKITIGDSEANLELEVKKV